MHFESKNTELQKKKKKRFKKKRKRTYIRLFKSAFQWYFFQPKEIGGVGIRKTEQFDQALLAKQYWRINQNPQSLLATTLKGKYFPKAQNLWDMERCPTIASQLWKGIWRTKETLLIGAKWQVGMGDGIKLRDPLW